MATAGVVVGGTSGVGVVLGFAVSAAVVAFVNAAVEFSGDPVVLPVRFPADAAVVVFVVPSVFVGVEVGTEEDVIVV